MDKLDLRKQLKYLYAPSARQVELVEVPELQFAMLDGTIPAGASPESSTDFQQAMGALYGVTYTLKFTSKLRPVDPIDYTIMPLQGLWWTDSGGFDFQKAEPWHFTVLILQPDHVTAEMFQEALQQLEKKRPNPALSRLRLERFREGLSMQIMHIGPYADEPQTIAKMHAFAQEHGYRLRGKHHEIYLGDPRRTKPEKLKTVLRHPLEPIG